MHKLYSNWTTTLRLWNLSHFSQHGSKTENQEHSHWRYNINLQTYIAEATRYIFLWKTKTFLCNEVAYHNLAVHFSVNHIARTSSKSCEDWTEQIFLIDQRINDFFSLCSPSCKSSIHAKHVWFLLLAVLVTWWNHATLLAQLHIISRHAKFCSLRSQFFRAFQFFLKFSLACVTALFVLFHLLSLALTRFNSPHIVQCSVLSRLHSWIALGRGRSFAILPLFRLLILALCRSLSCCASDKLHLKR